MVASTEGKRSDKTAIQSLKKSETMLRDIYLPEIMSNKEKLNVKMKEKKSFIKMVNSHLESPDLSVDNRKERSLLYEKMVL